jgi:hypothetical protein
MSEAPRDGTEILAYRRGARSGTLKPYIVSLHRHSGPNSRWWRVSESDKVWYVSELLGWLPIPYPRRGPHPMITKRTKTQIDIQDSMGEYLAVQTNLSRNALYVESTETSMDLTPSDAKALYKWIRRRVREMEGKE